tara:strand:+ start:174 stop:332 length:159 start_codon:yes stop_codon:yes gene_type:complete
MWKWIKKLFTPSKQAPLVLEQPIQPIQLTQLTKGDRKKLLAQGKIKSIYNNK